MDASKSAGAAERLPGIDALRGLVIVLMTVDHASAAFNAGRVMSDSARSWQAGTALDPAQFFTRWITHLCAPTFVFLAGASLALSAARRARRDPPAGASWQNTRFLVTRGLFIAACDPLWMSWAFGVKDRLLLQVLYAIGGSFVAMAVFARLPSAWLAAVGAMGLVGHEALASAATAWSGGAPNGPTRLLLTGGPVPPWLVAYPLVPWLCMMMLGHAAGNFAATRGADAARRYAVALGAGLLAVFAVVRGVDGFGNAGLYRDDGSVVQWLHVSKYPPSLAYTALELGIMALLYAALAPVAAKLKPLLLLGQTSFFFYLLHVHLLEGASYALGLHRLSGLGATWLAAGATVTVLLPLCARYRRYKAAHPDGWARYV
jgi:uncharacterized membrane protein